MSTVTVGGPIDGFAYGLLVKGMAPTQPGLQPEPLEPGVDYRLIVEAGSARGEHDIKIGASPVAWRSHVMKAPHESARDSRTTLYFDLHVDRIKNEDWLKW